MNRLRTPLFVLLLALAAAGLIGHASVFKFFVTDDAFISFVYSKHLVEHGQLVFNLGEKPVEGYTNFLWTVLLAGLMKLGWKPESSSVVCGIGFAIGTMIVCAWWLRRLRDDGNQWSAWDAVPALLLAAVPGYACWSTGGLETQMFTFLVTLGGALYLAPRSDGSDRLRPATAIAFGLAALTRPEGNLFFALMLAHRGLWKLHCIWKLRGTWRLRGIWNLVWSCLAPSRQELQLLGIYALLVIPHFLWRHHYYGYWVPNTFYIKSSGRGGGDTFRQGGYYLRRFAEAFLVYALVIPPIAALLVKTDYGTRRLLRFAAFTLPVFFVYVASVGGDFMGLFRFVMPSLPLLALGFTVGLRALALRVTADGARLRWLPPLATAALLGGYVIHDVSVDRAAQVYLGPSDNGIDTPGYLRWYTEDRAAIGKWFGKYAQPDDYAAVGGAGAQVYYSGMRSLDCFGLSDEYIAHQAPAVSVRPGHQKYAPLDYQLKNHPTIITSNYYNIGAGPLERPDAEEWKRRGYHYVSVQIPGLSSGGWYTFLKRMDRRIGPLAPYSPTDAPNMDLQ
jgi:arabinofuranosyltransferase